MGGFLIGRPGYALVFYDRNLLPYHVLRVGTLTTRGRDHDAETTGRASSLSSCAVGVRLQPRIEASDWVCLSVSPLDCVRNSGSVRPQPLMPPPHGRSPGRTVFQLHVDDLAHFFHLFPVPKGTLPLYVGGGGRLELDDDP